MAKAKKLPSGSYRCLAYSHTDADGKRHYESFTADSKKEAEYLAAQFVHDKDRKSRPENLKIREVVEKYVSIKENVLSPSTVLGYKKLLKNYIISYDIGEKSLRDMTNIDLQKWINELAANVSPKTIRNVYGLISATLDMFSPDFRIKVTLPQRKDPGLYVPSDDDVKQLLEHIQGKELEIAVLLAAFGPMRRGEICALESSDITGNTITVRKAMVLTSDGQWVVKQPKTMSSYRTIEFPDFVIDRLRGIDGKIIHATPDQISSRFIRAVRFSHLPHFRFHDLRHYSASIMHAIGIPDQYIMERGGWASDNVMKRVYFGTIQQEKKKATGAILGHFEAMQHDLQHKIEK